MKWAQNSDYKQIRILQNKWDKITVGYFFTTLYSEIVKCQLFSDAFKPMHYEYYITTLSIVQWIAGEILTF